VSDHVAVRVPGEPGGLVGELDAAEHERHALDQSVGVDADSHPEIGAHPSGSWRRTRPSKTDTVS